MTLRQLAGVISCLILTFTQATFGSSLGGVEMPNTIKVGSQTLVLNGMGMRLATIFKQKVYAAGLYVETPSKDPKVILESKQIKKVVMHFLRELPSTRLTYAWKENFDKNCATECKELAPSVEKLNSLMVDVQRGDRMQFTFFQDHLEVTIKDRPMHRFEGGSLSKVILMTWLGPEPPNTELKEGLLGKIPTTD